MRIVQSRHGVCLRERRIVRQDVLWLELGIRLHIIDCSARFQFRKGSAGCCARDLEDPNADMRYFVEEAGASKASDLGDLL
jgi:hypothetical protein